MISECLNPTCRKELRYLREGRVVRVVRGKKEKAEVEHYWLCGECYAANDFRFAADGTVSVGRRDEHDVAAEIDSWLDPTLVA
jgi:hypothetical protein